MSELRGNPSSVHSDELQKAKLYVQKRWLPVIPERVELIQKNLRRGVYHGDPAKLLADLRVDVGHCAFFLSKLGEIVSKEETAQLPSRLLADLEISRLTALLEVRPEKISAHQFDAADEVQKQQLNNTLISTTTAAALAERTHYDADFTFISALVRELGLNLIAWNYPHLYQKALDMLTPEKPDLHAALEQILGYSPSELGFQVGLGWSKNADIIFALGLATDAAAPSGLAEKAKLFCEIGESLARINDPQIPGAGKNVSRVQKEIASYLGDDGFQLLKGRFEEQYKNYEVFSENFVPRKKPDPITNAARARYAQSLFDSNSSVERCGAVAQQKFWDVYQLIEPGKVSTSALNSLVSSLIPQLGFANGCLYLINLQSKTAVPMLRIGNKLLSEYAPLPLHSKHGRQHPVAAVLNVSGPVIYERILLDGEFVSIVASSLQTHGHAGILLLNMNYSMQNKERQEIKTIFQATLACLLDCLNRSAAAA